MSVHLILWLLVGLMGSVASQLPVFFWAVAAAFCASLVGRSWLQRRLPSLSLTRPVAARRTFLVLLLVNPALWGLTGAVTIVWMRMAPTTTSILFVLTGVAASGGMALAIDPLVRKVYAPLAAFPPVVAMLVSAPGEELFPSIAFVVFLFYIYRASAVVQKDYWNVLMSHEELAHRARQLEHLSATDALTQVSNRLHFDRQMRSEWSRAQRSSSVFTVIMVDIDHFKKVNDSCGHPFGDDCLKAVAAALQAALVRPSDLIARYGGEEFVAMLPATDAQGAAAVAARMHAAVAAIDISHEGRAVGLTCSIGVNTVSRVEGSHPAAAISGADQALYEAKRSGRDRIVVFSASEPHVAGESRLDRP